MAILGAPLGVIYDWATLINFEFSWKGLIKGAVAAGVGYLIKNFMTGINGNILTNSPKSLVTGGVDVPKTDNRREVKIMLGTILLVFAFVLLVVAAFGWSPRPAINLG
jgi:hypothetical protein